MPDPNTLTLPDLFATVVNARVLRMIVEDARDEDLGAVGDITSITIIDADRRGVGAITPRADGVMAGLSAVGVIIEVFGADLALEAILADGDACVAGRPVARLRGRLRDLLAVERTVLNLLGRLSGIATATRRLVDAVAGSGTEITDTRKTTPGWRGLEKYAVRCGGGRLHRLGLHDAALYKDNHLAGLSGGDLADAVRRAASDARARFDPWFVEVEVDGLDQLEPVLGVAPGLVDVILLDNFDVKTLRAAVALRDERAPGVLLESSGGVTGDAVAAIAATGVDRIAVGAITHSAPGLDLGLDVETP